MKPTIVFAFHCTRVSYQCNSHWNWRSHRWKYGHVGSKLLCFYKQQFWNCIICQLYWRRRHANCKHPFLDIYSSKFYKFYSLYAFLPSSTCHLFIMTDALPELVYWAQPWREKISCGVKSLGAKGPNRNRLHTMKVWSEWPVIDKRLEVIQYNPYRGHN